MISLQLDGNMKTSKKYNETIKEQQEEIDSLKKEIEMLQQEHEDAIAEIEQDAAVYVEENKKIANTEKTEDTIRWFDSKKMQQYFNVEIEEKAAVAACASDFFEKYNNIPETLKEIDTKDIVDAVIAELENRNNAAAEAEKQRIEAEKQQILDDLYLYGM